MEQIVIAVIGFVGLLVPTLLSTRFGKWRLMHQIQEESKTYDSIPSFLIEERAVLALGIKGTVEDYKDHRFSPWSIFSNVATVAWISAVGGSLGISLLTKGPDDIDKWWESLRPMLWVLSAGLVLFGLLATLLLVFGGVMYVLLRSKRSRPFAIWLLDEKLKVPGSARRRAQRDAGLNDGEVPVSPSGGLAGLAALELRFTDSAGQVWRRIESEPPKMDD